MSDNYFVWDDEDVVIHRNENATEKSLMDASRADRFAWSEDDITSKNKDAKKSLSVLIEEARAISKYNPEQERNYHGRFASGTSEETTMIHQSVFNGATLEQLEEKYGKDNAEVEKIGNAIDAWTWSRDTSTNIRNEFSAMQRGETTKSNEGVKEIADTFARLLSAAPPVGEMYRGMCLNSEEAEKFLQQVYQGHVDIGLSSFSKEMTIADRFSGLGLNADELAGRTPFRITVEGGARGIDISAMSQLKYEKEIVSAGRFEVLQDKLGENGQHFIRLRQVQ